MAGLPWVAVYRDLPRHRKSLALGVELRDPRAWTYLVEGWLWAAENAPDGAIRGEAAAMMLEAACGWRGAPGVFAAAAIKAGFIDVAADGLAFHSWEEHEGAHIAAAEASAKRAKAWREQQKTKKLRAPKRPRARTRSVHVTNASKMGDRDRDLEASPPTAGPAASSIRPADPLCRSAPIGMLDGDHRPEPLSPAPVLAAWKLLEGHSAAQFGMEPRPEPTALDIAQLEVALRDHGGDPAWLLDTLQTWLNRAGKFAAELERQGDTRVFLKPTQWKNFKRSRPAPAAVTVGPIYEGPAGDLWAELLRWLSEEGKTYALTQLIQCSPVELEGKTLILAAPDRHFGNWVAEHWLGLLENGLDQLGKAVRIKLTWPEEGAPPESFRERHSYTHARAAA